MINPPPFSLRNETKIPQKGLGSSSASPHSLQSPSQRPGLGWNVGYPRVSHPRIRILPCGAAPRPKDPSGKVFWGGKGVLGQESLFQPAKGDEVGSRSRSMDLEHSQLPQLLPLAAFAGRAQFPGRAGKDDPRLLPRIRETGKTLPSSSRSRERDLERFMSIVSIPSSHGWSQAGVSMEVHPREEQPAGQPLEFPLHPCF